MKKKILCVVGKSGVGKTTSVEYIEFQHFVPMIQSYTDRQPRYKDENGHTFLSKYKFDTINTDDMIAYQVW